MRSKQITIKGFIHWHKSTWSGDKEFSFNDWDLSKSEEFREHVLVMEHEFTVEIPADFDPVPGQIAALKEEKLRLQAKFAKDMMEIEDSISKLTAITYEVKS